MLILLIRHADAGRRDPARWPDDTARPMTREGARQQRRMTRRLARHGLVPALVLSSPWRRAWQTAELTAERLEAPPPVACAALAQAPSVTAIARAVGRREDDAVVALVGHEPWLGELAALLLAGDRHRMTIDWPKSGILGLAIPRLAAGEASLRFFWRPRS